MIYKNDLQKKGYKIGILIMFATCKLFASDTNPKFEDSGFNLEDYIVSPRYPNVDLLTNEPVKLKKSEYLEREYPNDTDPIIDGYTKEGMAYRNGAKNIKKN